MCNSSTPSVKVKSSNSQSPINVILEPPPASPSSGLVAKGKANFRLLNLTSGTVSNNEPNVSSKVPLFVNKAGYNGETP